MTDLTELKRVKDEIQDLVDTFQTSNTKAIEAQDAVVAESVETMNAKLTELIDEYDAKFSDMKSEQEAAAIRDQMRGNVGPNGETLEARAEKFSKLMSKERGEQIVIDADTYQRYDKAFDRYLRLGDKANGVVNEMSVGSDPDGGYWVDPDRSGRIVELIYESSPIRQVANIETIGTDALEGFYDLDEAGSGWVGETETRAETDTPEIGEWRIPVHEQYAMPITTQKVLDDAGRDIGGWLEGKVGSKLARTENTAFVNGTGVKQPRGFLTYASGVPAATAFDVIEQTSSGAAADFAATDPGDPLIDMLYGLKPAYLANAQWMMRRTTFAGVRKLKDGDGNYLFATSFNETGMSLLLLGHGIVLAEDMPAIAANALSLAVADWNEAYTVVERQGIRILRDPFTTKGKVKFYTTKRVGGDVVNFEAIKIMKMEA